MDVFDKLREKKRRVVEDMRASIRYTPDRNTDLLAFMSQYIKADAEQRPAILGNLRQCMDEKPYPNPYLDDCGYTETDVDHIDQLLEEYLNDILAGTGNPKRQAEAVMEQISQLNKARSGSLIDDWRQERLCGVVNGAAELAEALAVHRQDLG